MSTNVSASNKSEDIQRPPELATKLGYQFFTIPKLNRSMRARKKMVEWVHFNSPKEEIPSSLIDQLVEEIRSERHAQKENQGSL